MILLANGLPMLTHRLLIPWSGPWLFEGTLDAEAAYPGGIPCAIVGETVALVGTVDPDPDRTYKFAERVRLSVLAGGGGWHKTVRPQHYHSDGALALATVCTTTGAEVKEVVTVTAPESLGNDFYRVAGPASQVMRGRSWWVGLDGVTMVGPRVPRPQPPSLVIHEWNEADGTAHASCDEIIQPATIIVDPRFGTRIVRDVEWVTNGDGEGFTLWLVDKAPEAEGELELVRGLGEIAKKAVGAEWLRSYEYVVVAMSGDRVNVAPLDALKAPAAESISVWAGVAGVKAMLAPGTKVLVSFRNGSPLSPYISHFEPAEGPGWLPLQLEIDAVIGIQLGGAIDALPIARAKAVVDFATGLKAAFNAAATGPAAANFTALAEATTLLITALSAACPSKKVISA